MLCAEELVLLSLTPDGRPARSGTSSYVSTGVVGALVAELAMQERVWLPDGRIQVVAGRAPDDPLLATALDVLGERQGKKLRSSFGKLTKRIGRGPVIDAMVEKGLLSRDRAPLRPTRHPVLALAAQAELIFRVQGAARTDGPLSAHDAVLLALAGPCRLLEVVAPHRADHRRAKRRIAEATRLVPAAEPVRKAIEDAIAATAAATTVVIVAGGASG